MHTRMQHLLSIIAVLIVTALVYNDVLSVNIMEARNFVTAREILENGSWLLPTMNGELRIAKPPLPTWITTVPMLLAGTDANLMANRIPSGICAFLLALLTFLLARRITGDERFAATTVLVLATSYMFMWSARKNEWDIYTHTAMAGAIWALMEAFMRDKGKALFFLLFSLFMTVSFLSKGPVALWAMFLPFLISYCITFGTADLRGHKWPLLWSFALIVVLSSLWPAYVYLHTPHDAAAIASRESTGWFTNHLGPLWYYLVHLQEIVGIWVFFLFYGLALPFLDKNMTKQERLTVFWFILTIVFLTIIPEKKLRYTLPAAVPGAMVATVAIHRLRQAGGRAWMIVYGPFCLVSGILFLSVAGALAYFSAGRPWILAGVPPIAFLGGLLVYGLFTKRTRNAHLTAVAGLCLSIVFLTPVISDKLPPEDYQLFMKMRDDPAYTDRAFYTLGDLPMEIVWASGKKIPRIGPGHLDALKAGQEKSALIMERDGGKTLGGRRPAQSVKTQKTVYDIYLFP